MDPLRFMRWDGCVGGHMYIDFDGPGGGSRRRVVVVAVAAAVGLVKGVVTASQTTRSVAKREVGVPTLAPPPPPLDEGASHS